jgi:hypothetical protein
VKDARNLEELKDPGAGRPARDEIVRRYRKAYADFGVSALWSRRPAERPAFTLALSVADALRTEGNWRARALAVEIEAMRRAGL